MATHMEDNMTQKEFEKAVARYNKIMFSMALEHLTIGTNLTEEPEKKAQWNIRDLVAECDYQLSTYYEYGHNNFELRNEGEDGRRAWRNETAMYRRFIVAYLPFINGVQCFGHHCSKYDTSELSKAVKRLAIR